MSQRPPSDLTNESFADLLRWIEAHPPRDSRRLDDELKRRLASSMEVHELLENAAKFQKVAPTGKQAKIWQTQFRNILPSKRAELDLEDWVVLLQQQDWYFGNDIEGVKKKIPPEFHFELCHYHDSILREFKNSESFINKCLKKRLPDHLQMKREEAKTKREEAKTKREEAKNDFFVSAVVIDIEITNNHEFEEVCYWKDEEPWHWPNADDQELEEYLQVLEENSANCWIVGHNIICHDLKELRDEMGGSFLGKCPVWDTMVVQSLLEPWLVSQALTGAKDAHNAESDVEANRQLFGRQLEALDLEAEDYAQLREFSNSLEDFVGFLCDRLKRRESRRTLPGKPLWLENRPESATLILIPEVIMAHPQNLWVVLGSGR